ncbi:peptidoglycan D,D-transpeptidase FtsI family protein [Crossiella sp. CA198]|uniref:peptidoglycan D,D-transpeptidase FtsI family protein n=1 Tax=Crossiella sp. CA198 TaxID=3455607 RepID=UPI003F8D54BE
MNAPLRRVALAVMVMVLMLLANGTYIQVIKADTYRNDPRNSRVLLEEYSRQRGQISAAGGQLMATVENTTGRLKYLRKYTEGPVYAPITGYYSSNYGATGLEKAQDSVLNGSDPLLFGRRLSDLITGRDPRGGSVQTTIVPKVQQFAYKAMSDKKFSGAVVAMDPKTGRILAMVSTPSFDPNVLSAHDTEAQQKAWGELTKDPKKPSMNRAVGETYPPGSTFKMVTAAAALENGFTKDSPLTAAPTITLPGTNNQLENFNGNRCGGGETAPLIEALARSCNTAFVDLAIQLGETKLRQQAEKFGIGEQGQKIPIGVAGSSLGDIPDKAALGQSGIGQRDVRLTPLQDAVVAATIANGGVRMEPQLVSQILRDVTVLQENDPVRSGTAISSATAATLKEMMIQSESRTAGGGKISGVTIASKTGTAEHGANPKANNPHAWYAAFAPAEDPKIAVAVIVENGGDRGQDATGGTVAAPIGRGVIGAFLGGG